MFEHLSRHRGESPTNYFYTMFIPSPRDTPGRDGASPGPGRISVVLSSMPRTPGAAPEAAEGAKRALNSGRPKYERARSAKKQWETGPVGRACATVRRPQVVLGRRMALERGAASASPRLCAIAAVRPLVQMAFHMKPIRCSNRARTYSLRSWRI